MSDVNEVPADISMSASSFDENIAAGSAVASLSTTDPDTGDTHAYALVSGDGDADNSAFIIEGDQLKIINSPDFESKSSYSIRLETKDSGGLTFEQSFGMNVKDREPNVSLLSGLSGRQGDIVQVPIQISESEVLKQLISTLSTMTVFLKWLLPI